MKNFESNTIIGVDLGGTKILAGKVLDDKIIERRKTSVDSAASEKEVLEQLYSVIDPLIDESVQGIGIGVPSVVDLQKGIVYEVQNIPSWEKVHLKDKIESRYHKPAYINNDANCFAAGEKHFGHGRDQENFVALIVGTGIAAGLIINNRLFSGHNCGAGEFGMIPYLDHHFEYYCSGQFFKNKYMSSGEELHNQAKLNDAVALKIFEEFGMHLGNAIKAILYSVDPSLIIMGGSVSKAYAFFQESLWKSLQSFIYHRAIENLKIRISSNADISVLGAAALYYDSFSVQIFNDKAI